MSFHDNLIDQIQFTRPEESSQEKVKVLAPTGHSLTANILQPISWFALPHCAGAVANKYGFGVEETGFEYPSDLDPDEEPFSGVRLYDYFEELFVSEAAFDRLMLRYFDTMSAIAREKRPDRMTKTAWTNYLSSVEQVRARVEAE